jgi:hypothetical protein
MKKVLFLCLTLFVLGLTITACSKDDDNTSIEGKWVFSQEGFAIGNQEVLEAYEHTVGCEKDYWEFKTGSVLVDGSFYDDGNGCESEIYLETYVKSGNDLLLSLDGESIAATIMTLNSSTLKFKVTFIEDGQSI